MDDHERRVIRYLSIMRQLGMAVALVFVVGVILGISVESAERPALPVLAIFFGTFLVYYAFDRLMRVVLGSKYRPAEDWPRFHANQRRNRYAARVVAAASVVCFGLLVIGAFAG